MNIELAVFVPLSMFESLVQMMAWSFFLTLDAARVLRRLLRYALSELL
jgi:hypothetical protein